MPFHAIHGTFTIPILPDGDSIKSQAANDNSPVALLKVRGSFRRPEWLSFGSKESTLWETHYRAGANISTSRGTFKTQSHRPAADLVGNPKRCLTPSHYAGPVRTTARLATSCVLNERALPPTGRICLCGELSPGGRRGSPLHDQQLRRSVITMLSPAAKGLSNVLPGLFTISATNFISRKECPAKRDSPKHGKTAA